MEEKNNKKSDKSKPVFGILLIAFLILSSSYILQSCEIPSILDGEHDENTTDLNDDFVRDDEFNEDPPRDEDNQDTNSDIAIEYFVYDIEEKIINNCKEICWFIESYDTSIAPKKLEFDFFNEERKFGWTVLTGFDKKVKDGFCFYLLKNNCLELKSEDSTFNATINFDNCWNEEGRIYATMKVGEDEILCYSL